MANKLNENPGCLAAIRRLFGIKPKVNRQNPTAAKEGPVPGRTAAENLPYRVRDDFLSPLELTFYRTLSSAVGERACICPKVSLGDLFFVARPNENQNFRNRIVQKHLDFLLCQPVTMKPILGIELDDSTHERADRQERDEFVNQVFSAARLPLLHVPAHRSYNTAELAEKLEKYLEPGKPAAGSPPQRPGISPANVSTIGSQLPMCPKCNIPMVVRTVSRGEHQGYQFYGCANYPKCREMMPLKPQAN